MGSFDRGSSKAIKSKQDSKKMEEAMRLMNSGAFGFLNKGGFLPKFITDSKGNTTKLYKKGGLVKRKKKKSIMLKGRGGKFKGIK